MELLTDDGLFQPEQDEVFVRGSFNNWAGQDSLSMLEDGTWAVQLEISPEDHAWKLMVLQEQGSEIWESDIGNRLLPASHTGWLTPVWFNNDSLPRQDTEIFIQIRLDQLLLEGGFNPEQNHLAILGSHPALGLWQAPGQVLTLLENETAAAGWIELPGLGGSQVTWKAVVLDAGSQIQRWEAGNDHVIQVQGDESDLVPASGNGFVELDSLDRYFDHLPGWQPETSAFSVGADLSMLPRLLHLGSAFQDSSGNTLPALDLFSQAGHELLRLRLWVHPEEPWQGLDSTLAHAHRLVEAGFEWMLDFHFSDTWADPGQQLTPAAWSNLGLDALGDTLAAYTTTVLRRCCQEGIQPSYIQIGNEIDPGMLWPMGRVSGSWDTPMQWDQLAFLLGRALDAARDSLDTDCRPRTLFHLASSGNPTSIQRFIEELRNRGVEADGTGLSYYPWWHGDLGSLAVTLSLLREMQVGEIQIVETAYPWTLGWADESTNIVGDPDQLLDGYPATPQGQLDFAESLASLSRSHGVTRMIWWEPAWVVQAGLGSPWENLSLFNFDHQGLPALQFAGLGEIPVPWLKISNHSSGQLSLHWNADADSCEYLVEQRAGTNPWEDLQVVQGTSLLIQAAHGVHFYRVRRLTP